MTDYRKQFGAEGENIALKYLQNKGMILIEHNFRWRGGEIDLIMNDDKTLVFIEVRIKSTTNHGSPLETINYKKRRQIEKCARYYLATKKIDCNIFCRFDVLGIISKGNQQPIVEYVPNAFISGE